MSRAEYDALKSGGKPTVTVDAAEYAALVAFKAGTTKQADEHVRVLARLRELETIIRREMQEHEAELAAAHKRIKQLGG
jgi:hypothetical protein